MFELSELWFVLVGVLFVGFFFLEGFDFGVGMSTAFLARSDGERRVMINSIGPFWDANEVWLLTAGGAMFAAFPHWYATMFSRLLSCCLRLLDAGWPLSSEARARQRHGRRRGISSSCLAACCRRSCSVSYSPILCRACRLISRWRCTQASLMW